MSDDGGPISEAEWDSIMESEIVPSRADEPLRYDPADNLPKMDAADVVALLGQALEALDVWQIDGAPGNISDRVRLHALLKDAGGNFGSVNAARIALARSLAPDMEGPTVIDGRTWKPGKVLRRRRPDHGGIRGAINRALLAKRLDKATGEMRDPDVFETIERFWLVAEPALGRTAKLAAIGIDLDDYHEEVLEEDEVYEQK